MTDVTKDGTLTGPNLELLTSVAARRHWRMVGDKTSRGCAVLSSRNHLSIPSQSAGLPGGNKVQPISSSVLFAFALFRAMEVVTQFENTSSPPRVTGCTWSIVAQSSQ